MSDSLKKEFILHPQLEKDTFFVGSLALCDILLMNDSRYPWIILVPRINDVCDVTDLSTKQRAELTNEIHQAAAKLKEQHKPDRLNIAMLGNVVPQLHCHIVARFETDFAWPKPVWGVGETQSYSDDEAKKMINLMRTLLID